jgi:lipopolysaccharide/colanic/teichoic acid biosynthesis glycosyltransferase
MQRLSDILISAVALLVLSPVLVIIIFVLRLTGEGEVFYSQPRIGQGGGEFDLLKFATMLKNSPNMGTGSVTLANDPRILPAGRILRKTKLNEVPQLFNVLRGDMSLVGPRPLTKQTFGMYPEVAKQQIATVKPGLSGVGSIVFRNEEKILTNSDKALQIYADVIAPYKAKLECWFVENRSFLLYLKTIFATIWVVMLDDEEMTWRLFPAIPAPPEPLKAVLGYR